MAKTYLSRWSIVFGTVLLAVLGSYQGTDASPSSPFELQPATGVPGATVSIVGKGLGRFKSAQVNRVLFGGVPALIQRWDSDVVEVKVPFKAQTGPVQVLIGKKKLAVGIFRSSIRKLFPFTLPPSNLAMRSKLWASILASQPAPGTPIRCSASTT